MPTKLDTPLYKFFRSICNSKIVAKNFKGLNIDNSVVPYHNLTKDRLDKAFEILNNIKEIIETIGKKASTEIKFDTETCDLLTDLSNEYYTLIPTSDY